MATDWSRCTATMGKFFFCSRRERFLKAMVQWTQDFYHVSDIPHIDGLNKITFKAYLQIEMMKAQIRKSHQDNTSSAADVTSPGNLETERQWKKWYCFVLWHTSTLSVQVHYFHVYTYNFHVCIPGTGSTCHTCLHILLHTQIQKLSSTSFTYVNRVLIYIMVQEILQ